MIDRAKTTMTHDAIGPRRTVLVLNHFAQPKTSPGGTRHVELFSRLSGWNARVIASNRNLLDGSRVIPSGVLETVAVTPYWGNGGSRILNWCSYAITSFTRGIRARPLDVVYGSSPHLLAALSGWAIALIRRKPFVLEVRDVWPQVLADMGTLAPSSIMYRMLERLETFLYRHADRIVFMAEGVRDHIESRGVSSDRLVFIPNGADADDFVPSGPREALRAHYRFEGVVAVYAGAHGPANGLDLLLDAATELASSHPQLRIVLVGAGATKPQLVERVRRDDIMNITFMDPIPKAEIPNLLAAADIGVHCLADVGLFRSGVSPNKLFDYMAAGLPVVTNTPGVVEAFVNASGGGLAVTPEGLAAGISQLVDMPASDRLQLGRHGQAHLEATRSRTAMAVLVEQVLDLACSEHRR